MSEEVEAIMREKTDERLAEYVADRAASLSYRIAARNELKRREQGRSTPGDVGSDFGDES